MNYECIKFTSIAASVWFENEVLCACVWHGHREIHQVTVLTHWIDILHGFKALGREKKRTLLWMDLITHPEWCWPLWPSVHYIWSLFYILSCVNSRILHKVQLHSEKIYIRCAVLCYWVVHPLFFRETVTA